MSRLFIIAERVDVGLAWASQHRIPTRSVRTLASEKNLRGVLFAEADLLVILQGADGKTGESPDVLLQRVREFALSGPVIMDMRTPPPPSVETWRAIHLLLDLVADDGERMRA